MGLVLASAGSGSYPRSSWSPSAYAVEEACHNLDWPAQRAALETLLQSVQVLAATPGDLPLTIPIDLAEKYRPILAMAVAARATHLLIGDVRHFGRYYGQTVAGVQILRAAAYLRARRSEEGRA